MVDADRLTDAQAQEIQRLTLISLLGTAADEDIVRLDQVVCENTAARRYYVRCMQTTCHLRTLSEAVPAPGIAEKKTAPLVDLAALAEIIAAEAALLDEHTEEDVAQPEPVRPLWRRGLDKFVPEAIAPWTHPYRFTAVAVVLTAAFWLGIAGFLQVVGWHGVAEPMVAQGPAQALPPVVAKVEASLDCDWGGVVNHATPDLRQGQQIRFTSGLLEVCYRSGATVVLEGPARYTLADDNSGRLELGKLTAQVPAAAQGFVVATPTAEVTDLGTSFGVVVDEGGPALVQVFQGMVLLAQRDASGAVAHSVYLEAGQAARVRPDDQQPQLVDVATAPRFARYVPRAEEQEAKLRPYAAADPDVVVLYHLDGDGLDASGHGLNLTADESPFTGQEGPQGLALAAGPFDHASRNLARDLREDEVARFNVERFTIEAWIVNPAALVGVQNEAMGVLQYREDSNSRVSLRFDDRLRPALAMQRADNGEFELVTCKRALPMRYNQWWYVAVTYEGDGQGNDSVVRFYAAPLGDPTPNLIDICKETPDIKPLTLGGKLQVGGLDKSDNRCFGGQLDEVRYVNRVLKPEEMVGD